MAKDLTPKQKRNINADPNVIAWQRKQEEAVNRANQRRIEAEKIAAWKAQQQEAQTND